MTLQQTKQLKPDLGHKAAEMTKYRLIKRNCLCTSEVNTSPLLAARLMRRSCVRVIFKRDLRMLRVR